MKHDKLIEQLHYVKKNIPYYQKNVRRGTCLNDFPFVTKSGIKNDYGAFISDEFRKVRRSLIQSLENERITDDPLEVDIDVFFNDEIIISQTSGSSGIPFRCPKTIFEKIRLGMGVWRQRRLLDFSIQNKQLYRFAHGGQNNNSNPRIYTLDNLEKIYKVIAQGHFKWLHTSPEVLKRHLEVFVQEEWFPLLPDLKFIECTGDFLSETDREIFSTYFGVKVLDQYAMQETSVIALTCIHGVHHINDYNVIVEIIDENNNLLPLGDTGRIVVSSLQEHLQPFIRYVTGDFGALVEKRCDCALGCVALKISEGREINLIKGGGGGIFGSSIFKWVILQVRERVDCLDLRYLRVKQISIDEFVIETNRLRQQIEFIRHFEQSTNEFLGRKICLRHIVVCEIDIAREELMKPWLFRCEF